MPDESERNDDQQDESSDDESLLDELHPVPIGDPDEPSQSQIVQKVVLCSIATGVWLTFAIGAWFVNGTSAFRAIVIITVATAVITVALLRAIREPLDAAEARIIERYSRPIIPDTRTERRILLDNEILQLEFRHHPMAAKGWWTLLTGWLCLFVLLVRWYFRDEVSGWLFIPWLGGLVFISVMLIDAFHDRYMVTSLRLLADRGILSKFYPTMPALKLTDMSCSIGLLARMLAWARLIETPYGTLRLENAGEREPLGTIHYVPNALIVQRMISGLVLRPAAKLQADEEEATDG